MGLNIGVEAWSDAVLGGALIGLALASLRILTGRVMSVSGMVGNLLGGGEGLAAPSIAFMAGVFIAPATWNAVDPATSEPVEGGWWLLAAAGLLMGFGARLGQSGFVGAIWGSVRRSGWAAVALGAIAAGATGSLFVMWLLGNGGAA